MASIIYNESSQCFTMFRGALDKDGNPIGEYYREYMKEHPAILSFGDAKENKKLKHIYTTKEDLLRVFNICSGAEINGGFVVSYDFDCWVCFDGNSRAVLYFGEDKPIRQIAEYKTICNTVKKMELL